MRIATYVLLSTLTMGCAISETPSVPACLARDESRPAPSRGSLLSLPSAVSGVTVTNASWRTSVSAGEGLPTEYLILSATLRADRRIGRDSIALVYDAPGNHAVVDDLLLEEGTNEQRLGFGTPFLEANQRKVTIRIERLRSDYLLGSTSALSYCPRTVRVVPRNALAIALAPDLGTPEGRRARMSALSQEATPLVVLMDTVVAGAPSSELVAGAAYNTTDSVLADIVIGLVVRAEKNGGSDSGRGGDVLIDTLEYLVGTVPPHALVSFAGGFLDPRERIVRRVVYRTNEVSGREVAGVSELNRASVARRTSRSSAASP